MADTRKDADYNSGTGPGRSGMARQFPRNAGLTTDRFNRPGDGKRHNHDQNADWDLGKPDDTKGSTS